MSQGGAIEPGLREGGCLPSLALGIVLARCVAATALDFWAAAACIVHARVCRDLQHEVHR